MKITLEIDGATYACNMHPGRIALIRIAEALHKKRNPAELIMSAAVSGLLAWEVQGDPNEALLDEKAFLEAAFKGSCGISLQQWATTGNRLAEIGRRTGSHEIREALRLHAKVGKKILKIPVEK